ncbi:D-methionine transport system permease protein metI [Providencia rustigianii]|uniref:D-methionine transport system permease protein MetI n=1 Tax=Providencia rustigianii TaxID=158850 RepID=A0A379G543_9GAMM|nr:MULTISPECIES: methionine ABC transporter permease [Providencia]MTC57929.1 methionine ABC transporter permease MetI [Providencia rustigianii]MTC59317.1 methionine ABC transporter permease MetI [Providencia rustigianii]SPY78055.1 D-methionine transport system permease protein metI [Providencia rustigianii]SUC36077.1 D-methionine transport system permease protein metI [Providencia rustigianii]VEB71018.1 D-methionine transport system permease protein metI [Providencia rustigianii]
MSQFFETALTSKQFLLAMSETFTMVSIALVLGSILGVSLGILLVITRPDGIWENKTLYRIINPIINIFRSLPFIILLVAIIPLTRFVVGTSIGTTAAIVPLVIYIAPYTARLVENSLLSVHSGIIEAADAMGATNWQIVWHFILPEAKSSLILSLTAASITLVGATAMAGAVGGGGVGDLALNYGYQRFDNVAMAITVVTLVIIVQGIQFIGDYLAKKARFH